MDFQDILYDKRDGIATVTMNRPEVLNAFRAQTVDEMIAAVGEERGALPLLAFAASRLWEKRDRERGLLTREAYREIGGVAGALAQDAGATLERVGTHRTPLVPGRLPHPVAAQGRRGGRGGRRGGEGVGRRREGGRRGGGGGGWDGRG